MIENDEEMVIAIITETDAWVVLDPHTRILAVCSGPVAAYRVLVSTIDYFHRKDHTIRPARFGSDGVLHEVGMILNGGNEANWSRSDEEIIDAHLAEARSYDV